LEAQIRNVSDDLHRELKARAALAGMSVSEYLLHKLAWLSPGAGGRWS